MRPVRITREMIGDGLAEYETQVIAVTDPPFFADPTGVRDSSVAIQNAKNALTEETGVLVFPPGSYKANNITFTETDTQELPKNLLISGYGATLLNEHISNPTFSARFTDPDFRHNIHIEGLRFDGNGEDNEGIRLERALSIKIRDCYFLNHKTAGIYAEDSWHCDIENVVVCGGVAGDDATYGIYWAGEGGNVVYRHVVVNRCDYGFYTNGANQGGGWWGCDVSACATGIYSTDGYATVINGCYFESNVSKDVFMGATGLQKGLVIEGCHFGAGAEVAIRLNFVTGPVIKGNSSIGHDTFIIGDASNTHLESADIHYNYSTDTAYCNLNVPSIASAATIAFPDAGSEFLITGTVNITAVTQSWEGRTVILAFGDVLTFTDGADLRLAGDFITSVNDTITLICQGTKWKETSRSAN